LDSLKSGNKTLRDFVKDEREKCIMIYVKCVKNSAAFHPQIVKWQKVYWFKKLTTLESLAEMEKEGRNIISSIMQTGQKEAKT
jgi:predicted HAD superfamily phosphohydrolase YqeG